MTKSKNSKTIKNIPTKSIREISEDYLNNRNNMPLPQLTAETKSLVKKGTTLKNEFRNLTKMKKWGGTKKRKNKTKKRKGGSKKVNIKDFMPPPPRTPVRHIFGEHEAFIKSPQIKKKIIEILEKDKPVFFQNLTPAMKIMVIESAEKRVEKEEMESIALRLSKLGTSSSKKKSK